MLETKHLRPTILAMDGHGSHGTNAMHLSFELLTLAKEEGIHIILLPPHTTNVLQPLDVGLFRPLKVNLSKLTDGLKLLSIMDTLDKTNFTAVFKEALDKTICLATIKNGFRKTGTYPFNPEAIDKLHLMPTLPLQSSNLPESIESPSEVSLNETENPPLCHQAQQESTSTPDVSINENNNETVCPQGSQPQIISKTELSTNTLPGIIIISLLFVFLSVCIFMSIYLQLNILVTFEFFFYLAFLVYNKVISSCLMFIFYSL